MNTWVYFSILISSWILLAVVMSFICQSPKIIQNIGRKKCKDEVRCIVSRLKLYHAGYNSTATLAASEGDGVRAAQYVGKMDACNEAILMLEKWIDRDCH